MRLHRRASRRGYPRARLIRWPRRSRGGGRRGHRLPLSRCPSGRPSRAHSGIGHGLHLAGGGQASRSGPRHSEGLPLWTCGRCRCLAKRCTTAQPTGKRCEQTTGAACGCAPGGRGRGSPGCSRIRYLRPRRCLRCGRGLPVRGGFDRLGVRRCGAQQRGQSFQYALHRSLPPGRLLGLLRDHRFGRTRRRFGLHGRHCRMGGRRGRRGHVWHERDFADALLVR